MIASAVGPEDSVGQQKYLVSGAGCLQQRDGGYSVNYLSALRIDLVQLLLGTCTHFLFHLFIGSLCHFMQAGRPEKNGRKKKKNNFVNY